MHFTNLRRVFASRTTLLMVCLSLGAVSTSVAAATFIVNSSDDNNDGLCDSSHCSLREAINTLNTAGGGTISFDSMVFPRSGGGAPAIVPTSALPSITASRSTIDGSGGRVVLDGSSAGFGHGLLFFGGADALDRITIREIGVNNFSFNGIFMCGGDNNCEGPVSRVLLERVSVANNGYGGIFIFASSIDRVTIRDSVAVDNASEGIELNSKGEVKRSTVDGCTVRGNDGAGISLTGAADLVGLRVTGNVVTENTSDGIRAYGNNILAVRLDDNTATANDGNGISVAANNGALQAPKLLKNVTSGNAVIGIRLQASTDIVKPQLKGNISTANSKSGIFLFSSGETSRANLSQNLVSGNSGDGIFLQGTRGVIMRNTVSGNHQIGIRLEANASNNRIERNVTDGNSIFGLFTALGSSGNKLNRNEGRGNDLDDFYDGNGDCGTNVWRKNQFGSSNLDCIQ